MTVYYLDYVLAVGSFSGIIRNAVELLDLKTWTWVTKAPYRFEPQIHWAPIVNLNDGRFMLFGGSNGPNKFTRIAAYDPLIDEWTFEGHLLTARFRHAVTTVPGGGFIIIGGYADEDTKKILTEKCRYVDDHDELECAYQDPFEPWDWTHLFTISSDFCTTHF